MNVERLMELLKQMPLEAPIMISVDNGFGVYEVKSVALDYGRFGIADARCVLSSND